MYLFLFIIPLYLGSLIWLLPYILSKKNSLKFVVLNYGLMVFLASYQLLVYLCIKRTVVYINFGNWISCGNFCVDWSFVFDLLSVSMLLMISFVSGCVHLFSISYMQTDYNLIRFFSLLSWFTFFMQVLVCSNNFILLFIGWEGIGICSYLLISFWNTKVQATKSALKAIVFNRFGDFGYTIGICLMVFLFRSVDFDLIFPLVSYFENYKIYSFKSLSVSYIDLLCLSLLLGVIGKSAQLGLHLWLPDAMEGPTPVSALIHAATLVTAGVFLIIRCSFIFEFSTLALLIMLILGGLTALFGATSACTQYDMKKIIAFSTTSQLGYMVFCCGLSYYNYSFFHLINHAFFKSLLFLSAGALIHASLNNQDIRKFGSLITILPFTYIAMAIGSFSLSGLPFLSGFFSKDLIIENAFSCYTITGTFVFWVSLLTAFLTSFYSFRSLYLIFYSKGFLYKLHLQCCAELSPYIGICLSLLSVGSIFSGYYLIDLFTDYSLFLNNTIYLDIVNLQNQDSNYIQYIYHMYPIVFSLLGILLAIKFNYLFTYWFNIQYINSKIMIYKGFSKLTFLNSFIVIWRFLNHKWYFDYIYNNYFGLFFLNQSFKIFYLLLDKGIIEVICVDLAKRTVGHSSFIVTKFQGSYLTHTLSLLLISIALFIMLGILII